MIRFLIILALILLHASEADAQDAASPLVRQAAILSDAGDTTAAIALLRSALSADSLQLQGYAQLGTLYLKIQHPDSALAIARLALRFYPGNVTLILLDGEALTGLRRFEEALARFEQVARSDASHSIALPDAQRGLLQDRIAALQEFKGMEELRDRNYARARERFRRGLAFKPSSLELRRLSTYASVAAGEWREAVRSAEEGVAAVGPDTSLLRMKSKAQYELHDRAGLKETAEQLLKLEPGALDVHLLFADALFMNEKVLEGLAALQKALIRFPRERSIYDAIVRVHRQRNDFKGIAAILKSEHEQFQEDQAVLAQLGEVYEIMNEWDLARETYDALGRVTNDSVVIDLLKARTYERQDTLAGAIRQYRALLVRVPDQPDALWGLGNVFDRQRRWEEAYEMYAKLCTLRSSSDVSVRLGWVLEQLRRPKEAAVQYDRALEAGTSDPLPHYRMSLMCKDTAAERAWELARTAFRRSLALISQTQQRALAESRGQDSLHYIDAKRDRSRQEEASALVETIFHYIDETFPSNEVEGFLGEMGEAYSGSGRLKYLTALFYRARRDTSRAFAFLEEAARLSPAVAEIHAALGELSEARGAWSSARLSYERCCSANENDPHTYAALIRVSEHLGTLQELSDRWLARFRVRKENSALRDALVEALHKAGRTEEAAEVLRERREE